MERPYVESELPQKRDDLIKLVQRQLGKWEGKLNKSRVTIHELKSALLDPNRGFTTNNPAVEFPMATTVPAPPQNPPANPASASLSTSSALSSSNVEVVEVRIYVEDCRLVPSTKTVAVISLQVLDHTDGLDGSFRVLGKDIISKLQCSNSAIEIGVTGMIRVSVPDPEDPAWKMPFVRMAHGQSVDSMRFDPRALKVTGNRVKLFIDSVTIPEVKAEDFSAVASSSTSAVGKTDASEQNTDNPGVKYLTEKLATRAGYTAFVENRGRVLSNPEVVKDWRFAVDFARDYNKLTTPLPHKVTAILRSCNHQCNQSQLVTLRILYITAAAPLARSIDDFRGSAHSCDATVKARRQIPT
ncbi:hypothetical protein C8R43DRAFT_946105 [Mycena crocata]|nr:hypothetical protein C8R43DRAFT_946105 [Mycena crocata]